MKTVEEIYSDMRDEFISRTGQEIANSGDLAVRFYAVAAQICALYAQIDWTSRQCFPQSATGQHLDLHAQLRGIQRKAATKAMGTIRFSLDKTAATNLFIPKGTVCMTAAQVRFETTDPATLHAGTYSVEIKAQALLAGSDGNVSANTISSMAIPPVGISRCENPQPFLGGGEEESDEELRIRLLNTYKRLPNGANVAYYEQAAMSFPEIVAAKILPRNRGIGTVDIVITTRLGLPDQDLIIRVLEFFRVRREIAVDVGVLVPATATINIALTITPKAGYVFANVRIEVIKAIRAWFDGTKLGKNVLKAELGQLVFNVNGVENYAINSPLTDMAMEPTRLPRLGTLSVTQMEKSL